MTEKVRRAAAPDESMEAASSPTSFSSSSVSSLLLLISPATLFRDALHTICTFLPFQEFIRTGRVNQHWLACAVSMKSREVRVKPKRSKFPLLNSTHLCALTRSPLNFHIKHLDLVEYGLDEIDLQVVSRLQHLDILDMTLTLTLKNVRLQQSSAHFLLPPNLREFKMYFEGWFGSTVEENNLGTYIAECMAQIAVQSTRLVKLFVEIKWAIGEMDCPQILQTISTLTAITLPEQFDLNQRIAVIKSMPSIRCWYSLRTWDQEDIEQLVHAGPPNNLEDIGEVWYVEQEMTEQLKQIPTLTILDISWMELSDPTLLLPSFPRLTILRVICSAEHVQVDRLVAALSGCITLTELSLSHAYLTHTHLSQILPHLTSLVELRLKNDSTLVSFDFLTTSKTTLGQLKVFENDSAMIPLKEYDHLQAIAASLEILTVRSPSSPSSIEIVLSFVNKQQNLIEPPPFESDILMAHFSPDSPSFRRQEWPKLKRFTLTNEVGEQFEYRSS